MGKRILVHGSIAIDYIMDLENNLYHLVAVDEKSSSFNMKGSVMPSSKRMQYGGTGGNISYNIGLLGADCDLVSSVGIDFGTTGYEQHLMRFKNLRLNLNKYTDGFSANCYIVNDEKKQQMIIFHGGVSQILPSMTLFEKGISSETISWGINSPENPLQMIRVDQELKDLKIKTILDTGQVTPAFNKDQLLKMIENSEILIANDNEFNLIKNITGLSANEILGKISTIIITKGSEGSIIKTDGGEIILPIVQANKIVDPTGAGDGYRAGLLTALHKGLSIEEGCKIGACVGSFVVETNGGQTHTFSKDIFIERYEKIFDKIPSDLF